MDLIPRLGRSPGVGNGNPFQYPPGKIRWTEEPGGLYSYYLQLYCALAYSEYLKIIFSFKKEKHKFYLFIYFFRVCRLWTQDHDTWTPIGSISALGAIAWSEQVLLFIFSLKTAKYIRLAAGAKFSLIYPVVG